MLKKIFNMSFFKNFIKKDFSIKNYANDLICFLLIFLFFILDRFSKIKVINSQVDENSTFINDFINFDLVWNTGIGFGLLSSYSNLIYNLITTIISIVIIFLIYLILKSKLIDKILFSLVVGGALGNFYDRLVYFAVPDFIDIHYLGFHWFTFNIADIFITIGIIALISKDLLFKK